MSILFLGTKYAKKDMNRSRASETFILKFKGLYRLYIK